MQILHRDHLESLYIFNLIVIVVFPTYIQHSRLGHNFLQIAIKFNSSKFSELLILMDLLLCCLVYSYTPPETQGVGDTIGSALSSLKCSSIVND
jgi:hypothetical protein